jgi:hypothetical protein
VIPLGDKDTQQKQQCTTDPLTQPQVDQLQNSIQQNWFFEGNIDGLPVQSFIGEMMTIPSSSEFDHTPVPHVYTSRIVTIVLNDFRNEIIRVDVSCDISSLLEVTDGASYTFEMKTIFQKQQQVADDNDFSRSTYYRETRSMLEQQRWYRYFDYESSSSRWFLVFLSTILVVVLNQIRKSLYNASVRINSSGNKRSSYAGDDDDYSNKNTLNVSLLSPNSHDDDNESTVDYHKQPSSSFIFNEPPILPIFAAAIGSGTQLLAVAWLVLWFVSLMPVVSLSVVASDLGFASVVINSLVFYAVIAGFVSAKLVLQYASTTNLQENVFKPYHDELLLETNVDDESTDGVEDEGINDEVIYTYRMIQQSTTMAAGFVGGFHLLVVFLLWIFARIKGTILLNMTAIEILSTYGSWIPFSIPFCLLGVLVAQRQTLRAPASSISKKEALKYQTASRTAFLVTASAGAINSIPICGEMGGFVFSSIWNYNYYLPSIGILLIFLLTVGVVVQSTQIAMYHLLKYGRAVEWQWTAFGCGSSTAVYVFIYGISFLYCHTLINGWYEMSCSICILFCISVDVGLVCGSLSYFSGRYIVHSIFQQKNNI